MPNRDAIDARVVAEVRGDSGGRRAVYHEDDVGGFPAVSPAPACADADNDGFDPHLAADQAEDADDDGYTNIEEYLNGTNPRDTWQ